VCNCTSVGSSLILFLHLRLGLQRGLLLSDFSTKIVYRFIYPPVMLQVPPISYVEFFKYRAFLYLCQSYRLAGTYKVYIGRKERGLAVTVKPASSIPFFLLPAGTNSGGRTRPSSCQVPPTHNSKLRFRYQQNAHLTCK